MKLKTILALVLAAVLLAACSKAPKKEESPAATSEESKEESSKEESSAKEEAPKTAEEDEEEEESKETAESSEEEEEGEEEEESTSKPEASSQEESDGINTVYKRIGEEAPEDTLLILINEPDDALLYTTRISDEFDLMVKDRVMMIPHYEHSTIRLWSLKMEFSDDGETAMQVHDELLYEVEDSTLETVLMTSVERIEDTARYAVEILTPYGDGEYYFNYYGSDLPQTEYISAAKG